MVWSLVVDELLVCWHHMIRHLKSLELATRFKVMWRENVASMRWQNEPGLNSAKMNTGWIKIKPLHIDFFCCKLIKIGAKRDLPRYCLEINSEMMHLWRLFGDRLEWKKSDSSEEPTVALTFIMLVFTFRMGRKASGLSQCDECIWVVTFGRQRYSSAL